MNNSSNSVFKSFFIYIILVHQKKTNLKKSEKIRKIREKSKKSKEFFEDLKIRTSYLGLNNPSISVLKSFIFFIYKILVHQKKISKNPKK